MPPFRNGSVAWLHNSNEASLVTFERADETNEFVVVINFSNRPVKARVETSGSNDFTPVQIDGMPRAAGTRFSLAPPGQLMTGVFTIARRRPSKPPLEPRRPKSARRTDSRP